MPTRIDRDHVQQLVAAGAALLEVLPTPEYENEHLNGARNLPLKQLTAETTAELDPSRPVVVYCSDSL